MDFGGRDGFEKTGTIAGYLFGYAICLRRGRE